MSESARRRSSHADTTKRRRHRRRLGVVVVVLLVLGAGIAYRYFTRPERIRFLALSQLRGALGREVQIAEASFGIWEGLELRGVEIGADPEDPSEAAMSIESVTVRLGLPPLLAGRLEPREVILRAPVLTLYQEVENLGRLKLPEFDGDGERSFPRDLFVCLKTARVRVIYRENGEQVGEGTLPLDAAFSPQGDGIYGVLFYETPGDRGPAFRLTGKAAFDPELGDLQDLDVSIPLRLIESLLPPRSRAAMADYQPAGLLKVTKASDGGDRAAVVELQGVSAALPQKLGVCHVTDVGGRVRIDPSRGIETLTAITGRIPRLGDERFSVSGRYDGFSADSPCSVKFSLDRFRFPEPRGSGRLEREIKQLWEMFRPDGDAAIRGEFVRLEGEDGALKATLDLLGGSGEFAGFPYRVEDVRGSVHLTAERAESFDITGRRGEARVRVYGHADYRSGHPYDVTVEVTSASFDEELRQAVPESVRKLWPRLHPSGQGDCITHVYRPHVTGDYHVDVLVKLDGRASMTPADFPYPLEGVIGEVHFFDDRLRILQTTATRGDMECMVDGVFSALDTDAPVLDLGIHVFDLPLDGTFFDALEEAGDEIREALRPSGKASEAFARVRQNGDEPVTYDVDARLEGVGAMAKEFPYELTDLSGRLRIHPDAFDLTGAVARHGPASAKLEIHGKLEGGKARVRSVRVSAKDVPLDIDLRAALPETVGDVWDGLSPKGQADIDVRISPSTRVADTDRPDYRIVLQPRDASVLFSAVPYPLDGITGSITVVPGRVRLNGMSASRGDAWVLVDGEIPTGDGSEPVRLSVLADSLPIDHDLISAAAQVAPKVAKRLKPGGLLTVSLHELLIHPTLDSPEGDAVGVIPPPSSAPAAPVVTESVFSGQWLARGSMAFREAQLGVGLTSKDLSGRVSGIVAQEAEGLRLSLRADLDRVESGPQFLTSLRGEIRKDPGNPRVQIRGLYARAHGGQVDGEADLWLGEPMRYSTRVSLAGVDLQDLLNAGIEKPEDRSKTRGLATAEIKLAGVIGRGDQRRGTGVLRITDAVIAAEDPSQESELLRLPVIRELTNVFGWLLPFTESGFSFAEMVFRLEGDRLLFREIYLRGAMKSFVGSGTVSLDTERIDVTFLGGLPGRLPRISEVADQVFQAISREFFAIQVSGTLSNPKVEKILLPSLNIVRRIFRPVAEDLPDAQPAPRGGAATTQKGTPSQ